MRSVGVHGLGAGGHHRAVLRHLGEEWALTMTSSTIPPPSVADVLALVERLKHRKDRPITSLNEFRTDLRLATLYLNYLACLLMISRRRGQGEPDQRLEAVLREYEGIKSQTD
jgi:hypothetical protein